MITRVTITGADDSIYPSDLKEITRLYPFVEWGILVSKKNFGVPRYPTLKWLKELRGVKLLTPNLPFLLSCHLCGKYVRDLSIGDDSAIRELDNLWGIFERVQINFHGIKHETSKDMITLLLKYPEKEYIFQYDDVNNKVVRDANIGRVNCSALFDKSGGAGVLPETWPKPLDVIRCGYAGGLSPDNLVEQIEIIESIVGDIPIWIDMETHVRSNNDRIFDLDKVTKCLELSKKYIK